MVFCVPPDFERFTQQLRMSLFHARRMLFEEACGSEPGNEHLVLGSPPDSSDALRNTWKVPCCRLTRSAIVPFPRAFVLTAASWQMPAEKG
jgi:hypothetical protein